MLEKGVCGPTIIHCRVRPSTTALLHAFPRFSMTQGAEKQFSQLFVQKHVRLILQGVFKINIVTLFSNRIRYVLFTEFVAHYKNHLV